MSSFSPSANAALISVGTSSSAVAIPLPGSATTWAHEVLVTNTGTNAVFVAFGGAGVTAAIPATDTPADGVIVPGGSSQAFSVNGASHMAGIASTGTNAVYFVAGVGNA